MSKRKAFWLIGLLLVVSGCPDNSPRQETQISTGPVFVKPDVNQQRQQPGEIIDELNFPELPQLGSQARRNLQQMHNGELDGFVTEPGFGVGRVFVPEFSSLATQSEKRTSSQDVHKPFTKNVENLVRDFGVLDGKNWALKKVLLVGLTKSDPVVYLTDEIPNMGDLRADVKTRSLDEFEKKAVVAFGDNRRLKVIETNNELRVMGPIYATKACAKCHKTEGELLGAFTYTIELHPNRTPTPAP